MGHIEVAAAILRHEGHILCMQRGTAKYPYLSNTYEFPGGKIEPGETPAAALSRELREELALNLAVSQSDFFVTVRHAYPDFDITLHTYLIDVTSRTFTLTEHIAYQWLRPGRTLFDLPWAAADAPILDKLCRLYAPCSVPKA